MSNLLAHSCLNLLTQHTFVLAAILNTFLSLNTMSSPPDWQWVSTLNKVHCDSGQQGGELWADQTVRKLQKMKSIWDHIERETQVICYTSDCREITFFFFAEKCKWFVYKYIEREPSDLQPYTGKGAYFQSDFCLQHSIVTWKSEAVGLGEVDCGQQSTERSNSSSEKLRQWGHMYESVD